MYPKRKKPRRDPFAFGWQICPIREVLFPGNEYLNHFCHGYADYAQIDNVIVFTFPSHFSAPDSVVHESRLTWVGGPLAAMVTSGFQETSQKKVSLSEEDDPDTFSVIRDFLYCKRIRLRHRTLVQLLSVIRSAHRWALLELFEVTCRYICVCEMLPNANSVLTMVDAVRLPGVPLAFKEYFWKCAGLLFDGFSPQQVNVSGAASQQVVVGSDHEIHFAEDDGSSEEEDEFSTSDLGEEEMIREDDDDEEDEEGDSTEGEREASDTSNISPDDSAQGLCTGGAEIEMGGDGEVKIEKRLCPFFPEIWELAVSQGVITSLMRDILWSSSRNEKELKTDLMHLVLQYLEPRIEADDTIMTLMCLLFSDFMGSEDYINRGEFQNDCSTRAMRLFSKALIASIRCPRAEMTYAWPVPPPLDDGVVRASYDFSYGMRGGSERRGLFMTTIDSVSQSLHFNVRIKTHAHRAVEFTVKWEVGDCFPLAEKDLVLRASLIDDTCNCASNRSLSSGYLLDRTFQHSLRGRTARFGGLVDDQVMNLYHSRYCDPGDNDKMPCGPSLWLQVRLVDP